MLPTKMYPNRKRIYQFAKINQITLFNTCLVTLFWLTMNHFKILNIRHGFLWLALSFVIIAKLSIYPRLFDKRIYLKNLKDYRKQGDMEHKFLTPKGRVQQLYDAIAYKEKIWRIFNLVTIGFAIALDISLILNFGLHMHLAIFGQLNGSILQILTAITENISALVNIIWIHQLQIIKQKAYQ